MSWLITLLLVSSIFTAENGAAYRANQTFNNNEGKRIIVLDETERFEQSYILNSNGKVSVSNINGSITVEAWDKNEVKLEVTKIADSKETLSDVELKIDSKPEYFSIETDYGTWNRGGNKNWNNSHRLQVEMRLNIPRTAFLDEIETVNGSVVVSNFTNYTKISAVNGSVKATNLRGTAKLSTVNGETIADFEQLKSSDKINLSTVNGRVDLTIPSNVNATVKADTVNGSIKNDFGLPVRKGKYVGKDLYGKIGSGETEIKLNSVNGGLSIMRKADGHTQNPVINLLPKKNDEDEDDWDDNGNDDAQIRKMNREIERSVRRTQAETDKAAGEADKIAAKIAKDIENIQPAINGMIIDSIIDSTSAVKVAIEDDLKTKLKEKISINNEKLARLRNINFSGGSPLIETKTDKILVKGKPKINIEAGNCDISVRGWDAPEVKYEFTHISKNRQSVPVEVTSEKNNSDVFIKVKLSEEDGLQTKNRILRLEVFVPKKSDLKIVTNGEIRLENITGEIDLSAGESSIDVRDSDGSVVLNSTEGKIRVIGFHGDVQAKSDEGDIYLEGVFDKISANTGEGNIFLSLPDEANAVFQTDGKINFEEVQSTKVGDNKWRIGNGDGKYIFQMPEGLLTVRKSKTAIYTK
ncbi:MAG: hypothetical protein ABIP06_00485 [Pyrinomonadaceae bacterium]